MFGKIKRKLIQIAAFGFTNSRLGNYAAGKIYQGKWKKFCSPGINCYSCPAATFACPIGAMQSIAGARRTNLSFYVLGLILAFGVVFGRAICGFLCPFGLFQELLHLIKTPKLKLHKVFTYIKYFLLAIFVIALPILVVDITGTGKPWFCEYICPVGTLEAGLPLFMADKILRKSIGFLFYFKLSILVVVLILCIFIYRFFCRVMCPLGAIYGLLNKISLLHLTCDKTKCDQCGLCKKTCKLEVDPAHTTRSAECILCGECTSTCPHKALHITIKPDL